MLYDDSCQLGEASQPPVARGNEYPCTSGSNLNNQFLLIMKKTLALLLAACSSALATDSITLSSVAPGNNNATTHGFYLSLSSDELQQADPSLTLTETAILESITLKGPNAASTLGGVSYSATYGLVVLGETDNTVLGYSTGTQTSGRDVNTTFSFTTLSGGALTLNTADTYRFITVSSGVLDLFTDSTKSYVYNAGGTGAATSTIAGDTVTITQGLTAPGMRWDNNASAVVDDCCAIFSSGIQTGNAANSPIITSMSIRLVPEPTTATLSLLALAGLAARRRRK